MPFASSHPVLLTCSRAEQGTEADGSAAIKLGPNAEFGRRRINTGKKQYERERETGPRLEMVFSYFIH